MKTTLTIEIDDEIDVALFNKLVPAPHARDVGPDGEFIDTHLEHNEVMRLYAIRDLVVGEFETIAMNKQRLGTGMLLSTTRDSFSGRVFAVGKLGFDLRLSFDRGPFIRSQWEYPVDMGPTNEYELAEWQLPLNTDRSHVIAVALYAGTVARVEALRVDNYAIPLIDYPHTRG